MANQRQKNDNLPCPCGEKSLSACCGPLHAGQPAASAERLMRSRYSAYVLGLEDYLLATWHPSTRPLSVDLSNEKGFKWLGLTVKSFGPLNEANAQAFVEFIARYKPASGPAERMRERSRFAFNEGKWFYLDGVMLE